MQIFKICNQKMESNQIIIWLREDILSFRVIPILQSRKMK